MNKKKILQYTMQTLAFVSIAYFVKIMVMCLTTKQITLSNPVFELCIVKNSGAAFSLLSSYTNLLIYSSMLILVGLLYHVVKNSNTLQKSKIHALSLMSAGILGNLAERIQDGFVTDYIQLNFVNFPIFNISDVLITLGAIVLIYTLYKNK